MSPYAVLVAVLLAFCYAVWKARGSSNSSKLPPSPPSRPVLGHLHLLGRHPHRSLRELHARYGTDGGLLLLQLGRRRTLVVSTAAAAAGLYKNHDLAFASRVPSAPADKLTYGSTNVSFAPYGDAWRRSKKVVRWATGLEKKLDAELEQWDKFLSEIIAEHLEKKPDNGAGEESFLDVLLRLREEGAAGLELTDDRIKSLIKDMIAGGTDTASVTLEWAMTELVANPRAMAKLQDEINRVTEGKPTIEEDDLSRMEYLKAVLKEVLRLHPAAPLLIPHQSTTAAVVQGYEIPAETGLFVNAWALGRDPAAWGATAEEFWPERFLGGGSAQGVDLRGNDYQLLPFGAGRRLCPGISFAMPVLETALSSLVRHFDWELPAGARLDMNEAPGLITPPLAPLRLVPKYRRQQ
ncbi:unnamed protein product [Triticum turgidum subsp. durum]|uniref:Cytochrome P450 n=1 Tax=Triticum turgidum subsp. durum TaxID=4567 RepID=A0A9R1AP08_TRITD|nr:unnamed protein product [Triticum turgidum subsp. durum]